MTHDHDEPTPAEPTLGMGGRGAGADLAQGFRLSVTEPPGAVHVSSGSDCCVGSHPSNHLVLVDRTVSRFHCELSPTRDGVRIRDLGSRNGTFVDGVLVNDAWLLPGCHIRLGNLSLRFDALAAAPRVELSAATQFGALVGASTLARAAFHLLERAALSDATVLLEGETGTGKGAAAEAVHALGPRRAGPFVVVDCGALAPGLLESELFGHERGAYTGADTQRIGAFEEADGGTLFLDEIGELPADLQPKLLRVLDKRVVRRLGRNVEHAVDVRVIAATNRDLREQVNRGAFRADLYYRLAVVRVQLPALRQRLEDLPLVVGELLAALRASPEERARFMSAELMAALARNPWPGNVRELRNTLERWLVVGGPSEPQNAAEPGLLDLPLADARQRAVDAFERRYLEALLEKHGGKVAAAARAAGVSRVYMYQLLAKQGLRP